MNEQIKENGSVNETNEVNESKFSWNKIFCWVALIMSVSIPVAAIGLSIVNLASITEDEDKEGCVICYISLAIAAYFVLSNMITSLFA